MFHDLITLDAVLFARIPPTHYVPIPVVIEVNYLLLDNGVLPSSGPSYRHYPTCLSLDGTALFAAVLLGLVRVRRPLLLLGPSWLSATFSVVL